MTRLNRLKINQLFKALPKNVVLTTAWLKQHDTSNKLAWWYVKAGWFEHIANGAYQFAGDKITWHGAVVALQQQLNLPIHVGGKTALQLLGKSHYLSKHLREIQLFGSPGTKTPTWLTASYWQTPFECHNIALFEEDEKQGLMDYETDGLVLQLSSPERAAIELCHLSPNVITLTETALIVEGLTRMRPKILQPLLESCQSVKAKRLLLYLADHFEHSWRSDIDLNAIDLGKGKRVLAGGGQYNAKYQLSVPFLGNHQ
ncbi:MAG: hypothetical protein GY821_13700 [Gammaproteobacteria bacterium]|nr:hypothetical protein [Gammaproteobacteria bacterium]